MMVYCDLSTANTGWIVIQRRVDATTSFDRSWTDYKRGFGNITHNYWMGLDNIHKLAGPGRGAKLRIEMRHRVNRSQVLAIIYESHLTSVTYIHIYIINLMKQVRAKGSI